MRRRYPPHHTQYPQLCKSLWIGLVHRTWMTKVIHRLCVFLLSAR